MRYILLIISLCMAVGSYAQRTDRDFVRRGNKLYADSLFVKAEVEYRRALDVNPQSMEAMYNLGNSLLAQQKAEEAMKQYQAAASLIPAGGRNIAVADEDKMKLAQIYHNMGVLLQSSQQLDACIEAYKSALRNNPRDHETRYNLTLAMKQRQQQQQEQQQNQDQQKKEEEKQEQEQQEQQNQQEQEQQEQQEQQQQQPQEQQDMSKENAEQMLNAIMQDEKEIQEKVQKAMQEVQPRRFEKDW
ncbi:MAG: tetratricopeptide repeat protein [Bacteroidaceae bacterium]|nr:tetratricopeptide repeat protein [Bacteroidaceae bacterium]